MRCLLPALTAAAVLAGCSGVPVSSSEVDERQAVLSELRTDVAAVAAGQVRADADVNDVLELVRAVDEAVPAGG